ncbi:hypothetical protein P7K49_018355 [Saguinus oedipus]|uniref:Uncharacterized protein n=1 Tax=Saguinus oedipus TaxID=9490 RepID=A0ABQ9V6B9_SAGOE|nr:hypothetical protein P7K49_018355 [Saguinus oedipus]
MEWLLQNLTGWDTDTLSGRTRRTGSPGDIFHFRHLLKQVLATSLWLSLPGYLSLLARSLHFEAGGQGMLPATSN